jgi:hypothetical protein
MKNFSRVVYEIIILVSLKLRYTMAHRGEKGTKDNVKVELLVTNYPTAKSRTTGRVL